MKHLHKFVALAGITTACVIVETKSRDISSATLQSMTSPVSRAKEMNSVPACVLADFSPSHVEYGADTITF